MFNDDKRKLYWLMNQYLQGKMSAWDFANACHVCYDVELDTDTLSAQEHPLFLQVSDIAGRLSVFEEDLRRYPILAGL